MGTLDNGAATPDAKRRREAQMTTARWRKNRGHGGAATIGYKADLWRMADPEYKHVEVVDALALGRVSN